MADTPPPVSIAPARRSLFGRASFVWIIPIMALAVSLAVAWQSYASRGPLIEIVFESAAGIKKRETELRYRDVAVGVVEDLTFSDDLSGVIAEVRLEKDIAPFVDVSAAFWVVTPELTTRGVSGLDTVLTGVYIEGDWDADIGPPQTRFAALPETPLFRYGQEGLQITLQTTPGGSLTDDSPITFRGIEVGRVGKAQISRAGNFAIADAIIYHPHSDLITPSTRFWDTSGFTFSVGTGGAEIDFSSVATLLAGGITFDTFVSGGNPVRDGALFEVFSDEALARNSLFRQPEIETLEMRVVFDENISGLAVDAPVELSGLRIGEVQRVSGIIDPEFFGDNRVRLNAVLSVQPARLGLQNEVSRQAALDFLTTRISEGLRARLATGGLLTGGLKIELVQVDDAPPATVRTGDGIIPIIPTTDSQISDVTATVEGVVSRINNLPIEELLTSAITFLDSASAFVADPDLRETPGEVRALLENLATVTASEDVQAIPATLNAALARIENLLASLEETRVADRLVAAVDAAAAAADGVSASVEGVPALVAQIEAVAARAEQLPLDELTTQLTTVLASADAILNNDAARALPDDLGRALNEINATLSELRAGGAVESINETLASTRRAADAVASSTDDLPALVARAQSVLDQASRTIAGFDQGEVLSRDAQSTLRDISRAADALASLARMLERNPSAFLRGR